MMKRIVYLLIMGAAFLLTGCHDVTVGYLFTEDAGYQIDTMWITSTTDQLEGVKQELDNFKENYPELQAQRLSWQEEIEARDQRHKVFARDTLEPLQDELYALEDAGIYDERYDELLALLEGEDVDGDGWGDGGYQARDMDLQEMIWEAQDELEATEEQCKDEAGLSDTPAGLEQKIIDLQLQLDEDIPFTTSPISSVEGTEPLIYEIEDVKGPTPEAVAEFRKSLGVMGGGMIYVKRDVVAPAGNYTVSLRITNEGRSKVVADAFTFVLKL